MTRIGTITKVQIDYNKNRVLINASISPTQNKKKIPFRTPGVGVWFVPKVGDAVELQRVGENRWVAFAPHTRSAYDIPDGISEGDIAFRLNDDTVLHFAENGGAYDVTVKCDGDLNLDAANIYVGDEDNAEPVARADHVHDYSWTDGGGSGTTSTEDKPPTETQIE